jgi:uncharacterized protein
MRSHRSRRAKRSRRMPLEANLSLLARLPRQAAHLLIRGYQLSLSAFIGRYCRHEPTCSAYMDEAIARHGLMAGGWLGTKRLCRCHPWGTYGYDPVPETIKGRTLRCEAGGMRSEGPRQ